MASETITCGRSKCTTSTPKAETLPDGWLWVHAHNGKYTVICEDGSDGEEHANVCPACAEMLFDWWCDDFERERWDDDEEEKLWRAKPVLARIATDETGSTPPRREEEGAQK